MQKRSTIAVNVNASGDFAILENVGDTSLPSDTCYSLRLVSFRPTEEVARPRWLIGTNTDTFTSRNVNLVFNERDEIDVKLIDRLTDNSLTIIKKHLTIIHARDIVSPLVGEFLGANIDSKSDTFRVSVKYWYGTN